MLNSKQITHEQKTEGWYEARRGKLSSSRIKDILSNPRSKTALLSSTSESYMYSLLSEVLTNETKQLNTLPIQWGNDNEPKAVKRYEEETMTKIEDCTFFENTTIPMFGGSPDGLTEDKKGIIEVKCPYNTDNHIKTILEGMPKEHMPQIQSNLLITNLDYCDFISYDPRIKDEEQQIYIERITRDNDYIDNTLLPKIKSFTEILTDKINKLTGN